MYSANNHRLVSLEEAAEWVKSGKILTIAGEEELLAQLPKGNWTGGTIPYFMVRGGGTVSRDKVFVSEVPECCVLKSIQAYGPDHIVDRILDDTAENGFTHLVAPANSQALLSYAKTAPNTERIFFRPLVGWISGLHMDDWNPASVTKVKTPKVFNGQTGEVLDNAIVALHVSLPPGKLAEICIVNPFQSGEGPVVRFPSHSQESFVIREASIDGQTVNLPRYVKEQGIDTRNPLVMNLSGAHINVSFPPAIEGDEMLLNQLTFDDVDYHFGSFEGDYLEAVAPLVPPKSANVVWSCNCLLNYLYYGLEGKEIPHLYGPTTYGEIAYFNISQTAVFLAIKDVLPFKEVLP
jgi:hypothetical protein